MLNPLDHSSMQLEAIWNQSLRSVHDWSANHLIRISFAPLICHLVHFASVLLLSGMVRYIILCDWPLLYQLVPAILLSDTVRYIILGHYDLPLPYQCKLVQVILLSGTVRCIILYWVSDLVPLSLSIQLVPVILLSDTVRCIILGHYDWPLPDPVSIQLLPYSFCQIRCGYTIFLLWSSVFC